VDLRSMVGSEEAEPEESLSALPGPWAAIVELAKAVLAAERLEGNVVIALADEAAMADLNRRFRGVEGPTDVLSFCYGEEEGEWLEASAEEVEDIGEVVLCPAVIERCAEEEGVEPGRRLAWSLVHGVLHLAGYDHEQDQGEMAQREAELLSRLDGLAAAVVVPPVR